MVFQMIDTINNYLWTFVVIIMVISSIYFTIKLKGAQFNFKEMFKNILKNDSDSSVSPFSALMLSLGGRIGVGSISGVALAIYIGGSGTIFWLWVMAFIGSILTFCETVLANKYHIKSGKNYVGGPSYYIEKGLKKRSIGVLYSLTIIIAYVCFFIAIQSNTITKALNSFEIFSNINYLPIISGIFLACLIALIIYGGIDRITNISNKLVPVMGIFYLLLAFIAIFRNIGDLPSVFINIFKNAFTLKAGIGGLIGSVVLVGIKRSIFSSEAGIGTGAIASSVSNTKYSSSLGYVQMLGIYITTLVICTSTALIVLLGPNLTPINDANGIEFAQNAFTYHFGTFGTISLFLCVFMFSFSTILTGYYYGESCFKHIFKTNSNIIIKWGTIIIVFVGSIASSNILWSLVDLFIAFLAIINIYAMFKLRGDVYDEYQKYENK